MAWGAAAGADGAAGGRSLRAVCAPGARVLDVLLALLDVHARNGDARIVANLAEEGVGVGPDAVLDARDAAVDDRCGDGENDAVELTLHRLHRRRRRRIALAAPTLAAHTRVRPRRLLHGFDAPVAGTTALLRKGTVAVAAAVMLVPKVP